MMGDDVSFDIDDKLWWQSHYYYSRPQNVSPKSR